MWTDANPKTITDKIVSRYKQWGIRQWDNEYDLVCNIEYYIECYVQNIGGATLDEAKRNATEWLCAYYRRRADEAQQTYEDVVADSQP